MYLLPCLDTLAAIEPCQWSGLSFTWGVQNSYVYISFILLRCSLSHHHILEYIFVFVNLLAIEICKRDWRSLDIIVWRTYKIFNIPRSGWRESLDLYDIFNWNKRLRLMGLVGYGVCDTCAYVGRSAGPTGPPIQIVIVSHYLGTLYIYFCFQITRLNAPTLMSVFYLR